jgi:hypothetical protein
MKKKLHPYTANNVSPINCICCGKELHLLYPENETEEPESAMWGGGVVSNISAGYGSNCDGDVYLIGLCDECLRFKRNDGSAIFLYDYMMQGFSENMRNEYNTKLHRKMKLKRILDDTKE